MAPDTYVAALDQGTWATRFTVFDSDGAVVASSLASHEPIRPGPRSVVQDAAELWSTSRAVTRRCLSRNDVDARDLAALGVTNQRETVVVWDADTGEPLFDAISWQDRRGERRLAALEPDVVAHLRSRTGLVPDPYFSAPKLAALLDRTHEGASVRERAAAGEVLAGTVDSWLVYNLTGRHVTDVSNASRTMLFDVHDLTWDERLCTAFDIPPACLPRVAPSADPDAYGETTVDGAFDEPVPVTGVVGDQQAALIGLGCGPGEAKLTYGTGSFLLQHTGREAVTSDRGLLTTVAYQMAGESPAYALEGPILVSGSALEWLEEVSLLADVSETVALARGVDDPDGTYVVPALLGIAAPYWDTTARGTVLGLTRGSRRGHVVRALLESIGFLTRDICEAIAAETGTPVDSLRVDGGATNNDFFMTLQADAAGRRLVAPNIDETAARGVAALAGCAVGYWDSMSAVRRLSADVREFTPGEGATDADRRYARWGEAVERASRWAPSEHDESGE